MVGANLFFKYPDYYTDAIHTLRTAASHECIRMEPAEVKDRGGCIQEHAGAERRGA